MNRNVLFLSFLLLLGSLNINKVSAASPSDGQGIAYYRAGFPLVAKPLLISENESNSATKAETSFVLGNIYFCDNQLDSASYYFKKGLTADPLNSLNSVGLTMLKVKSEPAVAEQEFKAILKLKQNKKNIDICLAIANAYLFNNVIDNAIVYQEMAKDIKTKNPLVYVVLGDIEVAKKNIGEACKNYEQAIYFDANCKEAYIKYARAYRVVNPTLAIEKLNALKAKEPSFLLVDRELADIYYATNDFAKAAELYENYLKSGNSNVMDLTKYAFTLFLNGQFAKSLEVANLGLAKAPRNPAFNRLAMYNNVDLKNADKALVAADLFFNKSEKPEFTFLDYRYLGQAYRDKDNIEMAIPQFEKALSLDSTKVDLWKDISDMYSKKNIYSKAIPAYLKYVKGLAEDKKTVDVYMPLGKMYYGYGTSDTTLTADAKKSVMLKADSLFGDIAQKEPTVYRGTFWRARVNSVLDNPNAPVGLAKPYYDKAIQILETKADARYNPYLIECYRYLGSYYYYQKDLAGSIAILNKALTLDPNNAIVKQSIDEVTKEMQKKKK